MSLVEALVLGALGIGVMVALWYGSRGAEPPPRGDLMDNARFWIERAARHRARKAQRP